MDNLKNIIFLLLLAFSTNAFSVEVIVRNKPCQIAQEGHLRFISGEMLACVAQKWIKLNVFPKKDSFLYYTKTNIPWDGKEIWTKKTSFFLNYTSRETGECSKVDTGHWGRAGARIINGALETRIQWNYGGRIFDTKWRKGKTELKTKEGAFARFANSRDIEFFGHLYSCDSTKLGKKTVSLDGVELQAGE